MRSEPGVERTCIGVSHGKGERSLVGFTGKTFEVIVEDLVVVSIESDASAGLLPLLEEEIAVGHVSVSMAQAEGSHTIPKRIVTDDVVAGLDRNDFRIAVAVFKKVHLDNVKAAGHRHAAVTNPDHLEPVVRPGSDVAKMVVVDAVVLRNLFLPAPRFIAVEGDKIAQYLFVFKKIVVYPHVVCLLCEIDPVCLTLVRDLGKTKVVAGNSEVFGVLCLRRHG